MTNPRLSLDTLTLIAFFAVASLAFPLTAQAEGQKFNEAGLRADLEASPTEHEALQFNLTLPDAVQDMRNGLRAAGGFTMEAGRSRAELLSEPVRVPLTGVAPFLAVGGTWQADGEYPGQVGFDLRFSNDGRTWSDWVHTEMAHASIDDGLHYGDLAFADDKDTRYVQFRLVIREREDGVAPVISSVGLHFINPTASDERLVREIEEEAYRVQQEIESPEKIRRDSADMETAKYPRPSYVSRGSWGGLSNTASRTVTTVTHLVVHHSAGNTTSNDFAAVVRSYWHYHTYTLGWGDIGYNWLVDPNGVRYQGRAFATNGNTNVVGAHAAGFNSNSMGLCAIGLYTHTVPSSSLLRSMERILAWKADERNINPTGSSRHPATGWTRANICGHRDVGSTACPGDQIYNRLGTIRNNTRDLINPPDPKGTLSGVVYHGNDSQDLSRRISGATINLSPGGSVTTNSNGAFSFELDPGTYTVTASKKYFSRNSVQRNVTDGSTTHANIQLVPQPDDAEFQEVWSKTNYSWLDGGRYGTERSMAYHNGKIYIASRGDGDRIRIVNASDGSDIGSIDASSLSGGTFDFNTVGVSDDGYIFASNLTTNAHTDPFRVYVWENDQDDSPVEIRTVTTVTDGLRIGDHLTVTGSVTGGTAMIYAPIDNGSLYRWAIERDGTGYNVEGGGPTGSHMSLPGSGSWDARSMFMAPKGPGRDAGVFTGNKNHSEIRSYNTDNENTGFVRIPGWPTSESARENTAISYQEYKGHRYLFSYKWDTRKVYVSEIQSAGSSTKDRSLFTIGQSSRLGTLPEGDIEDYIGDMAVVNNGDGSFRVYVLVPGDGLWAQDVHISPLPAAPVIDEVDFDAIWSKTDYSWLDGGRYGTERSMAYYDGKLYVASRGDGDRIRIIDAATGNDIGSLDASSLSGGTFDFNTVGVSDDGYIFASNLTTNAHTDAFRVYVWENDQASSPVEIMTVTTVTDGLRIGDHLTVTGSVADGTAMVYAPIDNGSLYRWIVERDGTGYNVTGGGPTGSHMSLPGSGNWTARSMFMAPKDPGKNIGVFAGSSGNSEIRSYNTNNQSTGYVSVPDGGAGTGNVAISYQQHGNQRYLFSYKWNTRRIYVNEIRSGGDSDKNRNLFHVGRSPELGTLPEDDIEDFIGDMVVVDTGDGIFRIYVLVPGDGIWTLDARVVPPPVVPVIDDVDFDELWSKTDYSWFDGGMYGSERSIAYHDGKLYVASRGDGNRIRIIDAATGNDIGSIDASSLSGGTLDLNTVGVSDDGYIFASNLTTNAHTDPFRVYVWENDQASSPAEIRTVTTVTDGLRIGDYLTVTGSVADGTAMVYAPIDNGSLFRWAIERDGTGYNVEGGGTDGSHMSLPGFTNWTERSMFVAPKGPGRDAGIFAGSSRHSEIRSYNTNNQSTGYVFLPDEDNGKGTTALSYQQHGSQRYLFSYKWKARRIYVNEIRSGGSADKNRTLFHIGLSPELGTLPEDDIEDFIGDMVVLDTGDGAFRIYVLVPGDGIWALNATMEEPPAYPSKPEDEITFYPLWQKTATDYPWFGTSWGTERSIAYHNGKLYVASRGSGDRIRIIDTVNGNDIGSLDASSLSGGTLSFNTVGVSDDGYIFASNLTADASETPFRIYVWENGQDNSPVEIITRTTITNGLRVGDHLSVTGSVADGTATIYAPINNGSLFRWIIERDGAGYNVQHGGPVNDHLGLPGLHRDGFPYFVSPKGPGKEAGFFIGNGTSFRIMSYHFNESTGYLSAPDEETGTGNTALSYQQLDGHEYIFTYKAPSRRVYLNQIKRAGSVYTDRNLFNLGLSSQIGTVTENTLGDMAVADKGEGVFQIYVLAPGNAIQAFEVQFEDIISVLHDEPEPLPKKLELAQNYPNPFNPSTIISYGLPEEAHVRITIYDIMGRQVARLVDETREPGRYNVTWDASHLASGIYIYHLQAGNKSLARRMTLIK